MIEAAAGRRILAMIGVFHHPKNVADLVDREIHLETAYPEHDRQKWNPGCGIKLEQETEKLHVAE